MAQPVTGQHTVITEAPSDLTPHPQMPLYVGGGALVLVIVTVALWASLLRRHPTPRPQVPEIEEQLEVPVPGTPRAEPVAVRERPSEAEAEVAPVPVEEAEGLMQRMRRALTRTRTALRERLDQMWGSEVDEAALEHLEEVLLTADVGIETTERLLEPLRARLREGQTDPEVLRTTLRADIRALFDGQDARLGNEPEEGPWVLLVVGVNGSGKTTTIGKLAARFVRGGRRVMIAAADTYRAAAVEQLRVWADRAGADIVAHQPGADPGAVVYDALEAARARGHDVVIIDTAGRLQTMRPLMEQLSKVRRVIDKQVPGAPHETLLVLDGTMGQNGLSQARLFHEATPLTGCVITKLDGTAKGGMILTIAAEMHLPVKLVGIGEKIDDLADFDADAFASAVA